MSLQDHASLSQKVTESEINLIFVKFGCGVTIVKYPFPKWYL